MAGELERKALDEIGLQSAVRMLEHAQKRFEAALPGIKTIRDALVHFDEWSRGEGLGPQRQHRKEGIAPRNIASTYWSFAYIPDDDVVTMGPFIIRVGSAEVAALALRDAIYGAAACVDAEIASNARADRP